MSALLSKRMWTKNYSHADSPVIITEEMGLQQFSLECTSVTPVTIKGNTSVAGVPSEEVPLAQYEQYSYNEPLPIENFTITLIAGATAKLVALI